ncbi:serine hydrolase domain-containing protein [Georgenia sp. MJ206]|uniref:serine hydrolase domain-containing protein n=1 Tax=Georgenia wangjunii TaxID=3117730 RepID=UPI002F2625F0
MSALRRPAVLAAATALLLAGCGTGGQAPAETEDGTVTSTATATSAETSAVDDALGAFVDAGAVAAVVHLSDGGSTWAGAAGVADVERGTTPAVDAPVRIASITKAMVATVVVRLAERGELALDDLVADHLPGVLPEEQPVTVRHLLDHTSGMPGSDALAFTDVDGALAALGRAWTEEELVASALAKPWGAAPGTAFSYANENYVVLGMLVEELTGAGLAAVLEEEVFAPAEMSATTYPDDATMPADSLRGYLFSGPDPSSELVEVTEQEPSVWNAGAAVVSTAPDVTRFFRALFDGTLVSAESLAQMQAIGVEGYGLGLLAGGDACGVQPPELVLGQRGNGVGYRAISLASPDGERQATLVWTGTALDPAADPLEGPMNDLLVTALAATCP